MPPYNQVFEIDHHMALDWEQRTTHEGRKQTQYDSLRYRPPMSVSLGTVTALNLPPSVESGAPGSVEVMGPILCFNSP